MSDPSPAHGWSTWRMPILLAALTAFGLLAALLGRGIWHWAAWLSLAVPALVPVWHWTRTRRIASR